MLSCKVVQTEIKINLAKYKLHFHSKMVKFFSGRMSREAVMSHGLVNDKA
jgi:hypothetical protein